MSMQQFLAIDRKGNSRNITLGLIKGIQPCISIQTPEGFKCFTFQNQL